MHATWGLICGAIVFGTVVKVGTFSFMRESFKKESERSTQKGMERLKEAREYAHQAAVEREKHMPELTEEQEEQMKRYLKLVNQHGMNKLSQIQDDNECKGCPLLSKFPLRPPQ